MKILPIKQIQFEQFKKTEKLNNYIEKEPSIGKQNDNMNDNNNNIDSNHNSNNNNNRGNNFQNFIPKKTLNNNNLQENDNNLNFNNKYM